MTMTHSLQLLCIPAGKPPIALPYGEAPSSSVEPATPPSGGLDLSGSSGLLTNAEALQTALHGDTPSTTSTRTKATVKGGPVPSDDQIIEWAREVRSILRDQGYLISSEGLRYWVRYSFDALSPEYKAVGERINTLVRER